MRIPNVSVVARGARAPLPQMRQAAGHNYGAPLLQFTARGISGLTGTKTLGKFRDAFAGKSMASVRYEYMAQQADVEGELEAASVFRAVRASEENHAMGHLEFLQDSGDPVSNTARQKSKVPTMVTLYSKYTRALTFEHLCQPIDNAMEMLQAAIISENHDASTMYPEFARVAREEGLEEVAEWFDTMSVAEGLHLRRFQRLLEGGGHVCHARQQQHTEAMTLTEQRVAAAGGRIADSTVVCFCLSWDDDVDLDLHCTLPNGDDCHFNNKQPTAYATLDVDRLSYDSGNQVENIFLTVDSCVDGDYQFFVNYFSGHGYPVDFTFVCNQFGKRIDEGRSQAMPGLIGMALDGNTPCMTLTILKGKVANVRFTIPTQTWNF